MCVFGEFSLLKMWLQLLSLPEGRARSLALFLTPCACVSTAAAPAGGAAAGRPPPQRGPHQLLPALCHRPPHLPALQAGRYLHRLAASLDTSDSSLGLICVRVCVCVLRAAPHRGREVPGAV